jgi:SAM-dependent methyltransferase
MRDVFKDNKDAWNRRVAMGDRWTLPVDAAAVARARLGDWSVLLTPTKPTPRAWFGELAGARVLGLASAGGQQGPILAAAGARVTVFDASPAQLARDREVAAREGLSLETVEGDMADLSRFADGSFDLIFHPCSNCFVPDVRPVWREAARVLKRGGRLLAGFSNPAIYLVDEEADGRGEIVVRYRVPYSDLDAFSAAELDARVARGEPVQFGHTLEDQLGGQLDAGLRLTALYEDRWEPGVSALCDRLPCFMATLSIKNGD